MDQCQDKKKVLHACGRISYFKCANDSIFFSYSAYANFQNDEHHIYVFKIRPDVFDWYAVTVQIVRSTNEN